MTAARRCVSAYEYS